jgi:hypothetical protein
VRRTTFWRSLGQLRVWHLSLLVLFVAVAIVNIQDQGTREPAFIALACVGFLAYGILGCAGWRFVQRWQARLGALALTILYMCGMAALFLVATVIFNAIEIAHIDGRF